MTKKEIAFNAAEAAIIAAHSYLESIGISKNFDNSDLYDEVIWQFIRTWGSREFSPFLKILDFEALLYPGANATDYEGQIIPQSVALAVIDTAKKLLNSEETEDFKLSNLMREHLRSIIDNGLPYGVKVSDTE
jgi:hypothetical protein